ncbi:DUF86 domain-containing protein [Cruoricaptor ignavus]|uniref:HepT-like ribonuclease domain-containing protein n=1 Tax=Cruoricaptor ignavus TaxID=1118202 RepID=UPI00370D4E9B
MDEAVLKYLHDIQNSILEINSYFENKPKDFFEYQQNTMLKRAVERDLEIICEAMNRILKKDCSITEQIPESRSIISLRNLVIHAYDSISDEIIWSVIIHHLPKLQGEVEQLINHQQ